MKIARGFEIPGDLVTGKIGIIGRTGSGKTNTAVVMAEQMISSGMPVVIVDPQGDWWGLRSTYPIAILGGEHGDVPLESTAGTVVAEFVVAHRHPVLLDLFGMGEGEMVRFATDFARTLWRANREALHVFLDEADLFAPQRGASGHQAQCLGAWQNVVRRGRSRGLGCTMITQRSAVLNKDLLTQADPLCVHRLTSPNDLAAVDAYLDYYGYAKPARRDVTSAVAKLKVGECMVISPGVLEIEPTQISVHKRQSYDSSATPKAGETRSGPRDFATVDLKALRQSMADTIERAKADDPKELRKQIAELRNQISGKAPIVDDAAIDRAVAKAVAERDRHWQGELRKLESAIKDRDGRLSKIERLAHLGEATVELRKPNNYERRFGATQTVLHKTTPQIHPAVDTDHADWFRPAHQRLLDALAWLHTMGIDRPGRTIVAAVAGVSPRSSSFGNDVSRLSAGGLIRYPSRGVIELTDEGAELARAPESPPTLEELHDAWRACPALRPAHVRLLDAVIASYPDAMTREELAEAADVSPKSSSFGNDVSRLSAMGLVEYPAKGYVRASEDLLFPALMS